MKKSIYHLSIFLAFLFHLGCGSPGSEGSSSGIPNPGNNTLTFSNDTLKIGETGNPYSVQLEVSGGVPPYSFSIIAGNLPDGLLLNSANGMISGTPVSTGQYPLTISVADCQAPPSMGQKEFGLSIVGPGQSNDLQFLTTSLPAGTMGIPYSTQISASGGTPPYTFSLASGTLPSGISLNNQTGLLSGSSTQTGLFQINFKVIDNGQTQLSDSRNLTLSFASNSSNNPIISATASRLTGVAPLSVFFDASGTSSNVTNKPFHHLYYHWDFADPNSRRPIATSGLAAHVFEHPGKYEVLLTVSDKNDGTSVKKFEINVQDPNSVFSGIKTICFSNTTSFTGAPTGSRLVTTSSFETAMTYLDNNTRILFKRGDVFTTANGVLIYLDGPTLIGAFGTGINPDSRGIFANNPIIRTTTLTGLFSLGKNGRECKNLRLVDLTFETPTGRPGCLVSAGYRVENVLMYRLKAGWFRHMLSLSNGIISYYKIPWFENNTVADCNFWECSHIGAYLSGKNVAVLGTYWFSNPTGIDEHILRFPQVMGLVVSGNYIKGANRNKHCIKLHAETYGTSVNPEDDVSKRIVISNNEIHSTTDWGVAMGTASSSRYERVQDVIVEGNTFVGQNGAGSDLFISCYDVTARNNIFLNDKTDDSSHSCIIVDKRGPSPDPSGVEIYHNTIYTSSNKISKLTFARVYAHVGGLLPVMNNLVYTPNLANSVVASNTTIALSSGNLINTNPLFTNPALKDFSLQATSPAINGGTAIPVMSDILYRLRDQSNPDIGAYEYY